MLKKGIGRNWQKLLKRQYNELGQVADVQGMGQIAEQTVIVACGKLLNRVFRELGQTAEQTVNGVWDKLLNSVCRELGQTAEQVVKKNLENLSHRLYNELGQTAGQIIEGLETNC